MKSKKGLFYALFSLGFLSLYFLERTRVYSFVVERVVKFCLEALGGIIYDPKGLMMGFLFGFFAFGAGLTFREVLKMWSFEKDLLSKKIKPGRRLLKLIKDLDLEGRVVLVKDKRSFAKVLGFLRGKIFVSSGLVKALEEQELKAVLLHEKKHLVQNDNFWRLIFYFFVYSTPFYIILKPLYEKLQLYQEAKADQFAIKALGGKRAVLLALKKTVLLDGEFSSSYSGAWQKRLEFLEGGRIDFWKSAVFALLILSFLVLFPFKAQGKVEEGNCIKGTVCYTNCSHTF